ncbi:MAG: EamA family transporter [Desulfobacterales bacterium]|nr:EamA family transporter [Desulfobacterales bacterium]MCP4163822.1 EamA family transporter [Deltaproteobacteria bacterium]
MNKKGVIELHIAVLLFGLAGLFGKFLSLSPFIIVSGRTFFASITLILIVIFTRKNIFRGLFNDYKVLLGGVILAIHWVSFFQAIKISTVAIGLLSFSTFPVFVTFLEPLFFKEKIRKIDIYTSIIVLLGLILVIPDFDLNNNVTQGVIYGVISGLTFAFLSLLSRSYVRNKDPINLAFSQNFIAFLLLIPFHIVEFSPITVREVYLLIVLGVFCTAIAHLLYIRSLRSVKAQFASIVASLEPVYGVVFALIFLNEIPNIRTVAGGLIILIAIIISRRNA